MARHARVAPGGLVYHALNRATARLPLFEKPADFDAFERVIAHAWEHVPTRVLAYCVMPNHWHLVLWPRADGELTAFCRRLAHTHTQRWHAHHGTAGTGHLYQGRFKSFPVEPDEHHLLRVIRYVERNALRAGLTDRAEDWRWCSLWRHQQQQRGGADPTTSRMLADWPVDRPDDWVERVNRAETDAELDALRLALRRGRPFGSDLWQRRTVERFGLEFTLRPPHRPAKS